MRFNRTYDLKTERGQVANTTECEVDAELRPTGGVSINGVFIGRENILLATEPLLLRLACAIAGEAESSKHILSALEDEAAEEFAERQARRVTA